jgi:hypothetical protein
MYFDEIATRLNMTATLARPGATSLRRSTHFPPIENSDTSRPAQPTTSPPYGTVASAGECLTAPHPVELSQGGVCPRPFVSFQNGHPVP